MIKRNVLITILVIIEISSLFLMYKSSSGKGTELYDVRLKEEIKENKTFGMYISSDGENYNPYEGNGFPSGYILNIDKSGCIDINGQTIENALSYDKEYGTVMVNTNKTAYCYLYFDEETGMIGLEFIEANKGTNGLSSEVVGGMYRYQGSAEDVTNNYICFGTTDASECTSNTDTYMYRIIGITSEADSTAGLVAGQFKLIKNEALNSTYYWYSSYTSNISWPSSTLYSTITGSTYLSSSTYMPSGWSDKIDTTNWKYGDITIYNTTADNIYSTENGWTSTTSSKVGLIYMHDYYYQGGSNLNCSLSGAYSTCKSGWMFISNCDSGNPGSNFEWIMSRFGGDSNGYSAWYVAPDGYVRNDYLKFTHAVRPVFFLNPDVAITGGEGTIENPYILS